MPNTHLPSTKHLETLLDMNSGGGGDFGASNYQQMSAMSNGIAFHNGFLSNEQGTYYVCSNPSQGMTWYSHQNEVLPHKNGV